MGRSLIACAQYQLSREEVDLVELSLRRCPRCESPAASFRRADAEDIARASHADLSELSQAQPVFAVPVYARRGNKGATAGLSLEVRIDKR